MENSLEKILSEFLIQLGDSNKNRYARFYLIAVNYLREFSQTYNGIPKIVELDISDTDTAILPNDYSEYRVIGICGADGKLHSLGRNDNICLGNDCRNEKKEDTPFVANIPLGAVPFLNSGIGSIDGLSQSFKNGEFVGKMFGVTGGNSAFGEFRIDYASGRIKFSHVRRGIGSVIMEYTPKLTPIDGDFEVPKEFIQTLKYWTYWQSIVFNSNIGEGVKAQARENYFNEDRWSRRKLQAVDIQTWYRLFRSQNSGSLKF